MPRLDRFRAEHPDIEIRDPLSTHTGMWSAHRDELVLAVKFELADLLDRLETELS